MDAHGRCGVPAELVALQGAILEAFPDCRNQNDDPSRGITRYVPHLSLGQFLSAAAAEAAGKAGPRCPCTEQTFHYCAAAVRPRWGASCAARARMLSSVC